MKKILLLTPFLLIANSCSNSYGRAVLTVEAPHAIVSGLKDSYSLNETAVIQFTPKPHFALPKKEQIAVEYGDKDFTYDENTGVLKIKLIANTIVNADASLNLGNNVTYEEWDRWCNARDTHDDYTFQSISVSWNFQDDRGVSISIKDNLNMDLVPFLLLQDKREGWPGIPELLTNLTGTFTHQWVAGELIPTGRDFIGRRSGSDLNAPSNKYSINGDQAIIFTDTFVVVTQTKDVPVTVGDAIIFFDRDIKLSKLIVMLDNFYSPFASGGPLNGTLEFNYVY